MDLHFVKLHGYLIMHIYLAPTLCSSSILKEITSRTFSARYITKRAHRSLQIVAGPNINQLYIIK